MVCCQHVLRMGFSSLATPWLVGKEGKEESSAADAPHLHYDLATATAEHEHGSDESRSAGHRRSSDGREQGRVIGRAHGPLGKTLACPLNSKSQSGRLQGTRSQLG